MPGTESKMTNYSEIKKIAKETALLTLEISYKAKVGHVGSSLSIVDILTVLYTSSLQIPRSLSNTRDRFILSKGHAAAALYATLYKKGILTKQELYTFGQNDGLCEHPEIKDKGIEMSTGSLGHGLAFGVGIAHGMKLLKKKSKAYVLISDGECGEGSVWEAALLAGTLQLDNLTVIVDYNKWQCFGKTGEVLSLEPFKEKWIAFGFGTREVDGHDIGQLVETFAHQPVERSKPSLIIAHTVSGKGISLIQDKLIGHYKVFSDEEYKEARKQLENL